MPHNQTIPQRWMFAVPAPQGVPMRPPGRAVCLIHSPIRAISIPLSRVFELQDRSCARGGGEGGRAGDMLVGPAPHELGGLSTERGRPRQGATCSSHVPRPSHGHPARVLCIYPAPPSLSLVNRHAHPRDTHAAAGVRDRQCMLSSFRRARGAVGRVVLMFFGAGGRTVPRAAIMCVCRAGVVL